MNSIKVKLILVSGGENRQEREWESLTENEKQESRVKRTERFARTAGYIIQGA